MISAMSVCLFFWLVPGTVFTPDNGGPISPDPCPEHLRAWETMWPVPGEGL